MYLSYVPSLPLYIDTDTFDGLRAAFYAIPLVLGFIYWRKYKRYKHGYEGEKTLTKLLKSADLPDDYRLINDFKPKDWHGNIDHILLTPKGIFAIETKNHKGIIRSYGDYWSIRTGGKKGQYSDFGSPSAQAKMNAKNLKTIIESFEPFKSTRIWVTPVVFLANLEADYGDLATNESTVAVKKLHELPQYLIKYENRNDSYKNRFSLQEIDLIGKELLNLNLRK